jgi:pimeloyl-ACP methyl ester carboxylesterase
MPYVTATNDVRLYYERAGATTGGPTVLLLMGLGATGRIWTPAVRRFAAAGYEVLTIDNRGSGRSQTPWLPWTTRTMAADAVTLLDALGLRRAHVVGASLGGMVAQEVALEFPERVSTLVLGCTTGGMPRFDLMPRRGLLDLLVAGARTAFPAASEEARVAEFLRLSVSPAFARDCPPDDEARRAVAAMLEDRVGPRGFAHQTLAAGRHSSWGRLDRLDLPVQVQHGTADRLIPFAAGRELARRIRGASFEPIEGAGHALVLERPDEIFDHAHRFIANHT